MSPALPAGPGTRIRANNNVALAGSSGRGRRVGPCSDTAGENVKRGCEAWPIRRREARRPPCGGCLPFPVPGTEYRFSYLFGAHFVNEDSQDNPKTRPCGCILRGGVGAPAPTRSKDARTSATPRPRLLAHHRDIIVHELSTPSHDHSLASRASAIALPSETRARAGWRSHLPRRSHRDRSRWTPNRDRHGMLND